MDRLQEVTDAANGAQRAAKATTAHVDGFDQRLSKQIAPVVITSIVVGVLGAGVGVFAFGASKVLSLLGLPALWSLAIAHGVHWWGVVIALVVTLVVLFGVLFTFLMVLNKILEWTRFR